MEAFLDLVAGGQLDLTPLLQNRCSVDEAANALRHSRLGQLYVDH